MCVWRPVRRLLRKRVVLAVCTGRMGSEMMAPCRKQRVLVAYRYSCARLEERERQRRLREDRTSTRYSVGHDGLEYVQTLDGIGYSLWLA
jgi:hypothetical protein